MDTSSATVSVGIEAKDLRRRLRKRLERRRPWRSHLGPFLGTGQNGVMSLLFDSAEKLLTLFSQVNSDFDESLSSIVR